MAKKQSQSAKAQATGRVSLNAAKENHWQKSPKVAAGRADQGGKAARKTGENRKPRSPQQKINCNNSATPSIAQIKTAKGNAEGLHGEGHPARQGKNYLGQKGDQSGAKGRSGEIFYSKQRICTSPEEKA